MLKDKTLTYISLFSSAGVGCYGFTKAGFACIATNELIPRRLNIQRYNHKCRFDSGYICGDITEDATKELIFQETDRFRRLGNDRVDLVIATPPCQGMSVANHKKTDHEIVRNSLVVESVRMIQRLNPRFFLFENVPAFMKTGCTAPDGSIKAIGRMISEELSDQYMIVSQILNFKNYGSNSSRNRTIVMGMSREMAEYISPVELFPSCCPEKTLREVIGDLPPLSWGEICSSDFYHAFRTYPEEMRCWIHDLKEGESAFDNEDPKKRPHRIVDGQMVPNIRKNGDKYTRQYWNRVAPCIHTRNDQLASQNTIHPSEDRVFSIRELMRIMTIPDDFCWTDRTLSELNHLPEQEKRLLLKKEEINIRQSIGEAVPTGIFYQIACNIRDFMQQKHLTASAIRQTIKKYQLDSVQSLMSFIRSNPLNLGNASLARIAELCNSKRENNAAYYTNKYIINEIFKEMPDFDKQEVHILEPSVGVGNFLPFIARKYAGVGAVYIDVVEIDENNLEILKLLLQKQQYPDHIHIRFIKADFLLYPFEKHYDLVIGNPPFTKLKARDASEYLKDSTNKDTTNTFAFFLEKALKLADHVAMIAPKNMLNTPEYEATRKLLSKMRMDCILDFGEKGFQGVLVETICLFVRPKRKPGRTKVTSLTLKKTLSQMQRYITDSAYPYWLIYRDDFFDRVADRLTFNQFTVFRDRQITNSNTSQTPFPGCVRVLKSRNISDDGSRIIDIPGYDAYIGPDVLQNLNVWKYTQDQNVYLTPNMTYNPRVMRNPGGLAVNGSVAVLIPKTELELTETQMRYFSTREYRHFYQIARNHQTRSLNVDASSVFFYGILKEDAHD